MKILNYEKLMNDKRLSYYNDYLPLSLIPFAGNYFARATDEALRRYYKSRVILQGSYNEDYLKKELEDWLKEHPEFQYVIMEG